MNLHVMGLYIEGGYVYTSIITRRQKKLFISEQKKHKISHDDSLKTFGTIFRNIKDLDSQKNFFIATGLETHKVIIKTLDIPLKKRKAVEKALPFQLEAQIPYPLNQAIVLPVYEKSPAGTAVKVFSTHQEHMTDHLQSMVDLGIDPDIVGCYSQALFRYMKSFHPLEEGYVVHLSDDKTRLIVISQGRLLAAHELEFSIKQCIHALEKDLQSDNEMKLRALLFEENLFEQSIMMYPCLYECLDKFYKELDRIFFYSESKMSRANSAQILALGEHALLSDLIQSFLKGIMSTLLSF